MERNKKLCVHVHVHAQVYASIGTYVAMVTYSVAS